MNETVLHSAEIPSSSNPDKVYFVRLVENEDGEKYWLCNCPAFLFRNAEKRPCKHIEQEIKKLDRERS